MKVVSGNNIVLDKSVFKNYISLDSIDYVLKPLSKEYQNSKGGNSSVFKLGNLQDESEYAIKISKHILNPNSKADVLKRIERFEREIRALKSATENNLNYIATYIADGSIEISSKEFRYLIMELADNDLTGYLKDNELSIQQRILICSDILKGIKQLHGLNIYHRDIKPDNILLFNKTWKVSDLGLIRFREDDFINQEIGEKIGPANWLSPEALNKIYNEGHGRKNVHNFDCGLDNFSDIFQLGKLFWFVLQGNIPDGQLKRSDFKLDDSVIYNIILKMLNHAKSRPTLDEIESEFQSRYSIYGL